MDNPISDAAVADAFPDLTFSSTALSPGGMKNAYRASSPECDDLVLKIVRQPLEPDEEGRPTVPERLRRELESMARVSHPRVVRILSGPDVRVIDGATRLWYTEPFVSGGDLSQHLGEPWPESDVLELGAGLMEGAEVLWSAGIVHRDIKPANIALDDGRAPVLLDLGIALVTDLSSLTASEMGSPRTDRYAAPEQFEPRGRVKLDFRTDLFAIGMVMFEALCGCHAFDADHPDGYLHRLFNGEWERHRLREVATSRDTMALLDRLLAPRQNQRFRLMPQARDALEGCR